MRGVANLSFKFNSYTGEARKTIGSGKMGLVKYEFFKAILSRARKAAELLRLEDTKDKFAAF